MRVSSELFYFLLLVCSGRGLFAHPREPEVIAGKVRFEHRHDVLHIKTSHKAIINWRHFSIEQGETARFILPNADSACLNRITSHHPSHLHGSLEANGKIYLINPNGIIFGETATVRTAGLIASTLDVYDQNFLHHDSELVFFGPSQASLINRGSIEALEGDVALFAYNIENYGEIRAKNGVVSLGAGSEILFRPSEDERLYIRLPADDVQNGIEVAQGGRSLLGAAINQGNSR